jgi:tetratricopeptide (TPR) repeat protein
MSPKCGMRRDQRTTRQVKVPVHTAGGYAGYGEVPRTPALCPKRPGIWFLAMVSLALWCGCKSAPPPSPVPEARRRAQFTAETAAKLSQAQNWRAAAQEWQSSADRFAALNDLPDEAVALHNQAQARRELGNFALAQTLLEQAAALNQESSRTNEWWRNQLALLQIEAQTKKTADMTNRFENLNRQLPALAETDLRGLYYNELGQWKQSQGAWNDARDAYGQAEQAFVRGGSREGLAAVIANRACLWAAQSNYTVALQEWAHSLKEYESLADPEGIARALAGKGNTLLAAKQDLPLAEKCLRRAARNFQILKKPAEQMEALDALVSCRQTQNEPVAGEQEELARAREAHAATLEISGQLEAARVEWQASADLWAILGKTDLRQKALKAAKRCAPH